MSTRRPATVNNSRLNAHMQSRTERDPGSTINPRPPAGFGWTPPFRIFRNARGVFETDFRPSDHRVTGKTYYLSTSGNNANDGLSWATAKQTLAHIFDTVPDYDVILVAAGEYNVSTGWGTRIMARSASIIAVGGRATISRRAGTVGWAAHSVAPVWLGTPNPAVSVGLVVDGASLGPTGLPSRLVRAATLAACETTPGTFFPSGTTVYVHLADARQPDDLVVAYHGSSNGAMQAGINGYFENIDFVGGSTNFTSSQPTGGPARRVVFNNCNFRFSTSGDAVRLESTGEFIFHKCIAEMAELDGFNYRGPTGGGVGVRVAEIDCISRWNGYTGSGFNNGSSLHGDTIAVSVNSLVEQNQNRNVHDVFTGAQRWALGCTSRNSRATNASRVNWSCGQIPGESGAGGASLMWLQGCTSSGSTTDLEVNQNAVVRLLETPTTGWAIVNNGGTQGVY